MSIQNLHFQPVTEALVLAGGLGTRLRQVVSDRQKVMAPVRDGLPFLAYILHNLNAAGVNRVILALGYFAEGIMEQIAPFTPDGMVLVPSIETEPMGTGGAIRHALPLFESDLMLIANGDSIVDAPLRDLSFFHQEMDAKMSMLLCEVPDVSRYGTVELNQQMQIIAFNEKQENVNKCSGIINAGVYLMSRKLIEDFPDAPHSLETEVFPKLCGRGLYGLVTQSPFIDIGIPEDYNKAAEFLSGFNLR